eukprot:CAMPEP_0119151788 /NCGR_PEP_ID=MMETSP1310-20130426/46804_1 /TAXON_ID=464262 /ORGANISM="Genus nov. species nov., Strain RCC2339" /LENGTH=60 /DNA_ID=CAMNT_0007144095 /DNA_START=60 /DNA_END=242 /DNA_ORIENTATION=-
MTIVDDQAVTVAFVAADTLVSASKSHHHSSLRIPRIVTAGTHNRRHDRPFPPLRPTFSRN